MSLGAIFPSGVKHAPWKALVECPECPPEVRARAAELLRESLASGETSEGVVVLLTLVSELIEARCLSPEMNARAKDAVTAVMKTTMEGIYGKGRRRYSR